jgi:hypothetical protein
MKTGDKVNVKMARGGIQSGTVVKVNADGSFVWINSANYKRTARPGHVTASTPRPPEDASGYFADWENDEGDE